MLSVAIVKCFVTIQNNILLKQDQIMGLLQNRFVTIQNNILLKLPIVNDGDSASFVTIQNNILLKLFSLTF